MTILRPDIPAWIQLVIALIVLAIGPTVVWKVGFWIARPLDLAAKNRRHPTQFTIVDFFCLFVLIQVPTALIHSIPIGPGTAIQEWIPFALDAYVWAAIGA